MTTDETIPVPLTVDQIKDLAGSVSSAHQEYCIYADNCDCCELEDYLLSFLPPPCPRCNQPMHPVATPTEPGDPSWIWGHDCDPVR
jgi:hypothetical protein